MPPAFTHQLQRDQNGEGRYDEARMSPLNLFGLIAVTLMMLFYWLEDRRAVFTLMFAAACLVSSAYGWLAGTWPFGIVELVWAGVAFARWYRRRHPIRTTSEDGTRRLPSRP